MVTEKSMKQDWSAHMVGADVHVLHFPKVPPIGRREGLMAEKGAEYPHWQRERPISIAKFSGMTDAAMERATLAAAAPDMQGALKGLIDFLWDCQDEPPVRRAIIALEKSEGRVLSEAEKRGKG